MFKSGLQTVQLRQPDKRKARQSYDFSLYQLPQFPKYFLHKVVNTI